MPEMAGVEFIGVVTFIEFRANVAGCLGRTTLRLTPRTWMPCYCTANQLKLQFDFSLRAKSVPLPSESVSQ